jgi:hypothetical protein
MSEKEGFKEVSKLRYVKESVRCCDMVSFILNDRRFSFERTVTT